MNEKLVLFETAVLAKEKGFDLIQPTLCYIDEDGNKQYETICLMEVNSDYGNAIRLYYKYKDYGRSYSIPTQNTLMDWLRDKHFINVRVACNSRTCFFPVIEQLDLDGTTLCGPLELKTYEKYEEALEYGLQEALKKL